jgi:hypothetical protein
MFVCLFVCQHYPCYLRSTNALPGRDCDCDGLSGENSVLAFRTAALLVPDGGQHRQLRRPIRAPRGSAESALYRLCYRRPISFGQPLAGCEQAAAAVRAAGLAAAVASTGWRFVDRGDLSLPTPQPGDPQPSLRARNAYAVCRAAELIAAATRAAAEDGHLVLTLGGDHSIALGSVAGVLAARPDTGVLWVDAHADINADDSPSGNIHGM